MASFSLPQQQAKPSKDLGVGAANQVLLTDGTAPSFGAVTNAYIDGSAAIAYSKLALTDSIVNADINASAAIAYSKLALTLTANRALATDASGFIVATAVTDTELGYVSGVTSGHSGTVKRQDWHRRQRDDYRNLGFQQYHLRQHRR